MRPILLLLLGALVSGATAGDTSRADALFAQRADPNKLEAAIDAYEQASAWTQAARGCRLRLEIHEDLKKDSEKEPWVERGLKDAAKALGVSDPDDVPDRLASFAKKDAPALYWFAGLYGYKIELSWKISQLGMSKKFRKMAERVVELDDAVYYGGAHRMLGDFYTSAPGMFGGDKDRAKRELERALEIEPRFLEARVLRARLAKEDGRPDDAVKDLEAILAAPDGALPEVVPEQKLAKADARKLLAEWKR